MSHIILKPGTPDDDNREYLPEHLKDSDVVVNENGNNSQPYPDRLEEHTGEVLEGAGEDTWYTYVPASYDGSRPVPLVISMHGGYMTGWGQAVYTAWTLLAEREGFIVLFPNAHLRRFWTIDIPADAIDAATAVQANGIYLNRPPADAAENVDNRLVLALIERLAGEYAIDRSRIFMQGMSMGNAMTGQFSRHLGSVLAGAAGSGGPTALDLLFDAQGERINAGGPLAIFQTRLERDGVPPHYGAEVGTVVTRNREYWTGLNGVTGTPQIAIIGEDNLAFFEGESAPVVFRDVKNRDHGQTLDDAEFVWSYLFSGVRREADGSIAVSEPRRARQGDALGIAVAEGSTRAWVGQRVVDLGGRAFTWRKLKYHGLEGAAEVRGEYLYVPLSFIADALGAVAQNADGVGSLQWPQGPTIEFARGSIVALVDGEVRSMLAEAVERDGQLYVSLEWVAQHVLGLRASQCEGVLYVTDHHAELSRNMALLIADLLA